MTSPSCTSAGALFDRYVCVDWSAHAAPTTGRNSIWVAHGARAGDIATVNPATRVEALHVVTAVLTRSVARGERVLVGCDFAYGWPAGLATALGLRSREPPWHRLWRLFRELRDDPACGGGDAANACDRWAVANHLNARVARHDPGPGDGPWWGRPDWTTARAVLERLPVHLRSGPPFAPGHRKGRGDERRTLLAALGIGPPRHPHLRMTSPGYPFGGLARKRRTEQLVPATHECWKLLAPGSVGSQALLGVTYLEELREHPALAPHSRVWPFETGFAAPTGDAPGPAIVHAEIYPSPLGTDVYRAAMPPGVASDPAEDRRQVWTLVEHARRLDARGELLREFVRPAAHCDAVQRATVLAEEGWILFTP